MVVVKWVYTVFFEAIGKVWSSIWSLQTTWKTLVPVPALCTSSFDWKYKLALVVGGARGPLFARGPIIYKKSVKSAKNRPCWHQVSLLNVRIFCDRRHAIVLAIFISTQIQFESWISFTGTSCKLDALPISVYSGCRSCVLSLPHYDQRCISSDADDSWSIIYNQNTVDSSLFSTNLK